MREKFKKGTLTLFFSKILVVLAFITNLFNFSEKIKKNLIIIQGKNKIKDKTFRMHAFRRLFPYLTMLLIP